MADEKVNGLPVFWSRVIEPGDDLNEALAEIQADATIFLSRVMERDHKSRIESGQKPCEYKVGVKVVAVGEEGPPVAEFLLDTNFTGARNILPKTCREEMNKK